MSVAPPSQYPSQIAFTKSPGGAVAADRLTAVARAESEALCRQALHADLPMLGQLDPCATLAGFVELVLISTDKPTLILPLTGKSKMTSRDVLIGWNATPQAARAVTASSAVAGDTLLSFASEVGADLLVMGCYGHSRARELMLGGALRSVLKSMTLPVLMAR